jgi:gas vesicle structural protein
MPRERGGYLARPQPSSLADVVEIVLDKGLGIDACVRVSLLGIELVTLDARVVVSSVDTYLTVRRGDQPPRPDRERPPDPLDMIGRETEDTVDAVASHVVEERVDAAAGKVGYTLGEPVERVVRGAGRKLVERAAEAAPSP